MKSFILKRLFGFIIVLIGVSILSFILISLFGNDPAEIIGRRGNINISSELIQQIREEMNLDKPIIIRYINWVKGLFNGNFGISIYSYRPIAQDLSEYLPVTIMLSGLSIFWLLIFSIPISLICTRFRNGILDHFIRVLTIIGICTPSFWLGFLLLIFFAIKIPLFNVMPEPGIKGYILPSLALAIPMICSAIRLFRASLISQLSSDYVQYARARGLSANRILMKHIFRNALPPFITIFCQYIGYVIAGGILVEGIFSLKGVGSYLINCINASDATAVATCIVIIASVVVFVNLASDVINRILFPSMVRESNV